MPLRPCGRGLCLGSLEVLLGPTDQVGRKPGVPERLVAGNPCVRVGLAEFLGYSDAFFTTRASVHDSGAKGAIR
jgi:hypothetical protein